MYAHRPWRLPDLALLCTFALGVIEGLGPLVDTDTWVLQRSMVNCDKWKSGLNLRSLAAFMKSKATDLWLIFRDTLTHHLKDRFFPISHVKTQSSILKQWRKNLTITSFPSTRLKVLRVFSCYSRSTYYEFNSGAFKSNVRWHSSFTLQVDRHRGTWKASRRRERERESIFWARRLTSRGRKVAAFSITLLFGCYTHWLECKYLNTLTIHYSII